MKLSDLTTFIKDLLAVNLPELPIILEDKGDIEYEANNALSKQGIYALVRFPQLNFQGKINDKLSLTATSMVIQISENVPVNRHKKEYLTCNDYAIKVSQIVMQNLNGVANLVDINIDYVEGLLIATNNFETTFQISE